MLKFKRLDATPEEIGKWNAEKTEMGPKTDPRYEKRIEISLRTLHEMIEAMSYPDTSQGSYGDRICGACGSFTDDCSRGCVRWSMEKLLEKELPPLQNTEMEEN